MGLRESLSSGKFCVTVELAPPKGTDVSRMMRVAEPLVGRVDGVNVTDNQRAVMRVSSLASCHLLAEMGLDPIMQLTCRDRNRLALQSEVLSAWVLGIHNIVAMTGDHPVMGDHPSAKPVFDLDSVQLIAMLKTMNEGKDMVGNDLSGPPDVFIGALGHPGANPLEPQMIKLRKKIKAGAQFLQTQAIYDVESFREFMHQLEGTDVKVLAGIVPLKSARMANFMNQSVPGIKVPESLIKRMETTTDATAEAVAITLELIEQLRDVCHGVHLMPIGMEKVLPRILDEAGFK